MNNNIWDEETIVEEKPKKDAKNIVAMILGILSIVIHLPVCNFIPFAWLISLVSSIVAKVLVKKTPDCGMKKAAKITSTIGLILCILSVVLSVVGIILAVVLISAAGSMDAIIDAIESLL